MKEQPWAIGVDIGGTKIDVARVDQSGTILNHVVFPTHTSKGFEVIAAEIITTVQELQKQVSNLPVAIGVGMAGQIVAETGVVKFAPNLKWTQMPLKNTLQAALKAPVVVLNDVRAGTWGEWKHGAGKGVNDLVCLFIGTGVGGGLVSHGHLITGITNSAGELGHVTVDFDGPLCTCGNRGCLEAFAGGWALAKRAEDRRAAEPEKSKTLLKLLAGSALTARHVLQAATEGDTLSQEIIDEALKALIAGCIGFVNAYNPERLILGGGLGLAIPGLIDKVSEGVRQHALNAATEKLQIVPAALTTHAGVIGAASYALSIHKL